MAGSTTDVMRIANARNTELMVQQLAAAADTPIVRVKVEFGPMHLDGLTRTVTMTAVDRLDERFAPTLFRSRDDKSHGRFLIQFFMAAKEYGTPITASESGVSRGILFGQVGQLYQALTDKSGVFEFDSGKGAIGPVWVHAGFGGLLRSAGINWTTGAFPTGTEADDAPDTSAS